MRKNIPEYLDIIHNAINNRRRLKGSPESHHLLTASFWNIYLHLWFILWFNRFLEPNFKEHKVYIINNKKLPLPVQ